MGGNVEASRVELLKVPIDGLGYRYGVTRGYYLDSSKDALNKLGLDVADFYFFFKTVSNPDAVRAIKSEKNGWEERFAKYDLNADVRDEFSPKFTPNLRDLYIETVEKLCKESGMRHVSYPFVSTVGVHQVDRPDSYPSWPVIHVIRDGPSYSHDIRRKFEEVVNKLNTNEVYDRIKEFEAPQNYNLAYVDFLREKGIPPLRVEKSDLHMEGSNLIVALNFLVPDKYYMERHDFSGED